MADRDVSIRFDTTANTSGAEETKSSMDDIKRSSDAAAAAAKEATDALDATRSAVKPIGWVADGLDKVKQSADKTAPAVSTVKRAVDAAAAAAQKLAAVQNPEKVRVQTFAYYDLDKAIQQTTRSVKAETQAVQASDAQKALAMQTIRKIRGDMDAATAASNRLAGSTGRGGVRNMGHTFQNAGFQIQDMAVQLEMGTAASRVMAQQLPQLLGGLGMIGAISGAVVALGSIVWNTFRNRIEKPVKESTERANELRDAFNEAAKAASAKEFEDFVGLLDQQAERQKILNDSMREADDIALQQAESTFRIAEGWKEAALQAIAFREATEAGFDAASARAALEAQSAEAKRDLEIQRARLAENNARQELQALEDEREALRERGAALQNRINELEATQASQSRRVGAMQAAGITPDQPGMAGRQLAQLLREQEQTAAEVKSVFNALDQIPQSFAQIETAAMAANEKLDQAIKTTAQRVEEINQAFESEQIGEQIQAGTEQAKQNVEDIKRFTQEFQAVTPIQEEAKQGLAASVSDNILTAEEIRKNVGRLQTLSGTLKTGQIGIAENLDTLIRQQSTLADVAIRQQADIRRIDMKLGGVIR